MLILHYFGRLVVGTLRAVAFSSVSALTTAALATEDLEATLLTFDQVTTRLTVFALTAQGNPEQTQTALLLLEDP